MPAPNENEARPAFFTFENTTGVFAIFERTCQWMHPRYMSNTSGGLIHSKITLTPLLCTSIYALHRGFRTQYAPELVLQKSSTARSIWHSPGTDIFLTVFQLAYLTLYGNPIFEVEGISDSNPQSLAWGHPCCFDRRVPRDQLSIGLSLLDVCTSDLSSRWP